MFGYKWYKWYNIQNILFINIYKYKNIIKYYNQFLKKKNL